MAATLDGKTAARDGSSKWITGEAARADVQRLRAAADAIVVGAGTVLDDDPSLTVATPGYSGRPPLRVVVDASGRVAGRCQAVRRPRPTLVADDRRGPTRAPSTHGRTAGADVAVFEATMLGRVSAAGAAVGTSGSAMCRGLLVEGGATLAWSVRARGPH